MIDPSYVLLAALLSQNMTEPQLFMDRLTMIPPRCIDANSQLVDIRNILVFYNRVVTFTLGGVIINSRLIGASIQVNHNNGAFSRVYNPRDVSGYNPPDVRLYHARLGDAPVIIWESTVENINKRVGILGYRGRELYSICTGIVPIPELRDRY